MDTIYFSLIMIIQLSSLLLCVASSPPTLCHESERSILLEFKKSFFNKTPDLWSPFGAYRKIESWKLEVESGNCCAWDGIECDANNGHVIGVELRDNCLSGSISSNTILFHLVHLQRLDLSLNYQLYGLVPQEILKLTNLLSLDLSFNEALIIRKPNLLDLVQNLTKLENLSLSFVDISAPVPNILTSLSSLRLLYLDSCNLQGEFPQTIFKMPKLEFLDVSFNEQLSVHLPEFRWRSSLKSLNLQYTHISGRLPSSVGNLASLTELYLGYGSFIGGIPSSIGNLTQLTTLCLDGLPVMGGIPFWIRNLTQLTHLYLYDSQLTGEIPSWIGQLSNLEWITLDYNNLTGEIPSSFFNLTRLVSLHVASNQFSGQILPQLFKLTHLSIVHLAFNNFTGSIPSSIVDLKDLTVLSLYSNNFNGIVPISLFSKLKSLTELYLSFNKLSLVDDLNSINTHLTKFRVLGLASCNLSRLPTFLQYQDRLEWLDLSSNGLFGEIPEWFLEMNTNVAVLNLSNNSLTSSSYRPLSFRWIFLSSLDLRHNNLKGPLPIPPKSIKHYLVSRNKVSGKLPPQICELREIEALDLSENNLTGAFPRCFSNLSNNLSFLSLHGNNFIGEISSIIDNGDCNLRMVDVSRNRFYGPLPRSLTRCYDLEFLNLGSNRIKDVFPSWLGLLRNLRVLILHSNEFHGVIGDPKFKDEFPSLQIVDFSLNNFESCLPSMYFARWHAMKIPISHQENYMGTSIYDGHAPLVPSLELDYTITIILNGFKMSYPKIQSYLTFVDLSSNNFTCEIPQTVEDLIEVQYLNLSNNNLIGPIPSFLKALTNLQALDLSRNKLDGKIPQELTQLTFLGTFNVSYNNLSGRIPEGRQFDTFDNNSYFGNAELCGKPLSKNCGETELLPEPQPQSKGEGEESIEIDWKVVLMGYGSGLVIGVVVGHGFIIKTPGWILKYFGRRAQRRRRIR